MSNEVLIRQRSQLEKVYNEMKSAGRFEVVKSDSYKSVFYHVGTAINELNYLINGCSYTGYKELRPLEEI
jgi:hypothetical protein